MFIILLFSELFSQAQSIKLWTSNRHPTKLIPKDLFLSCQWERLGFWQCSLEETWESLSQAAGTFRSVCVLMQLLPWLQLQQIPCPGSAEAVEAFSYIWVGTRQLKNLTHWIETGGMYLQSRAAAGMVLGWFCPIMFKPAFPLFKIVLA